MGKVAPEITQHQGSGKLQALASDAKIRQSKDWLKFLLEWANSFLLPMAYVPSFLVFHQHGTYSAISSDGIRLEGTGRGQPVGKGQRENTDCQKHENAIKLPLSYTYALRQ